MFEFIRTHRRMMHIVLLLLIVPSFAVLGVQGYSHFRDEENVVAEVAGKNISAQELQVAQREHRERFQQMFGAQFDPKVLDTPEAKKKILDNLIARQAMVVEASNDRLNVPDDLLQQSILAIPGLTNESGKFDMERYQSLLAMQGMTPLMHQARLRQELVLQQLNNAVQQTAFIPKTVVARIASITNQEREVSSLVLKASAYIPQVKITEKQLSDYYKKNSKEFEIPEHTKIEYLVLDKTSVAALIQVSDSEVKTYYEANLKNYAVEEQRRVSHILIALKSDAVEAEKLAAKTKAANLIIDVRKNVNDFAKLAKENSQDVGSAQNGGDLGFFSRGMTLKPFEDAVYKLKPGEISDVVQTDYGYHIIKLTDIKPASVKNIEDVKSEIVADIKKQKAAKKYSELAESFTDIVYEQSDSLKAASEKLHLKIETLSNVRRSPRADLPPEAPYNNTKFLQALFSEQSLKNKRNTEAVEVTPGILISGHVIEYKPATIRSFDEVHDFIRERVLYEQALILAKTNGQSKLAELKNKDNAALFGETKIVSRLNSNGVSPVATAEIMKAEITKLPAYVGVDAPEGGYVIYRINKVLQPQKIEPIKYENEQQRIANTVAQQETLSYIDFLKNKAKVKILIQDDGKGNTEPGRAGSQK